jgi:hypothetical protein
MSGVTYYTVTYHMQPVAHFRDYDNAVRFAAKERERRIKAIDLFDPPMLEGEKRGEIRSIRYGIAVRRVDVNFEDVHSEAIRFG